MGEKDEKEWKNLQGEELQNLILEGERRLICTVPIWGEKIYSWKSGGNMIFGENVYPCTNDVIKWLNLHIHAVIYKWFFFV